MILGSLSAIAKMVATGNFDGDLISAALLGISGGFGLIFARDNNVSSEEAGAKKE